VFLVTQALFIVSSMSFSILSLTKSVQGVFFINKSIIFNVSKVFLPPSDSHNVLFTKSSTHSITFGLISGFLVVIASNTHSFLFSNFSHKVSS